MERPKNSPRGTYDLLPSQSVNWQKVENIAKELFRKAAFGEIRTPIFEQTEIFQRAAGETSDIVNKEMYTFNDRSDRSITLRPEGTAGVVRAFLSNGMDRFPKPVKLWYYGPMFRYERSQTGRYRQFTQLGVEVFGSATPEIELEVISLAWDLFQKLQIPDLTLEINSVGDQESRSAYQEAMRAFLQEHETEICVDCQNRMKTNPLRALDCKVPEDQALYKAKAPKISAYLNGVCIAHQERLCTLLKSLEIPFTINESLVRGLDYYSKTVFEIKTANKILGTQNTICAGGRYDNLVKEFGGPQTPAFGWALGMERLTSLLEAETEESKLDSYVTYTQENFIEVYKSVKKMRDAGYSIDIDYEGRSEKKQYEIAIKSAIVTEKYNSNVVQTSDPEMLGQIEQNNQILYESENVRVEFDSSIPCVIWTPLRLLSSEEFKLSNMQGLNFYIEKIKELKNLQWLNNTKALKATKVEDDKWLSDYVYSMLSMVGTGNVAFVLPDDIFAKLGIRTFAHSAQNKKSGATIKVFKTLSEAKEWLQNSKDMLNEEIPGVVNLPES